MYDLITYITQYLEYESYISPLTMLSIKKQRIVQIQGMNLKNKKYYLPYIIANSTQSLRSYYYVLNETYIRYHSNILQTLTGRNKIV